jgi:hypothetical protein
MAAETPSGLLHLRTWLPEELDQRFSTWCNDHHLEQLAVPGFLRVRRFELARSAATEPPRFLTIYDLERLEVLRSDAYAEYGRRSPGLPEFLKGRLRAARTEAWLVAGVPAVGGVVPGGDGLAHLFVPDGPDLTEWFADAGLGLLDAVGGTAARLLRAGAGEQLVMVELGAVPSELDPAELPLPDGVVPGVGWGLYRLAYLATPDGAPRIAS